MSAAEQGQPSQEPTGQPGQEPGQQEEEGLLAKTGNDDQLGPESEDPPEDDEEIEVDGRKFALPKSAAEKLKAERMLHSDYTRKTQEVADQRRAVEAEGVQVRQREADAQAHVQEIATVIAIDRQLQQLNRIDFNTLAAQNPSQAMQLDKSIRDLQQARYGIVNTVSQRHQQKVAERERSAAHAISEGVAVLARDIPGWSEKTAQELRTYMVEKLGAKPERLEGLTEPALIKAIHKARLYDELQARQTQKPKPAAQPAPVTRITAKQSGTVRDPDKLSADDWVKWRNAQVRGQRKRRA